MALEQWLRHLTEGVPAGPINDLAEVFADPQFGEERADHFFCGTPGPSRDIVYGLIAEVGVRPICVGGPEAATLLDGITKLYFVLAIEQGHGRHTGFRMLSS